MPVLDVTVTPSTPYCAEKELSAKPWSEENPDVESSNAPVRLVSKIVEPTLISTAGRNVTVRVFDDNT
eukprot:1189553-Rhodomonas_salina.1